MRLAASRCIAIESSRGWRITKEKQSHKIDVIVALAMAAFAAVQGQNESSYDTTYRAFDPNYRDPDAPPSGLEARWFRVTSGGGNIQSAGPCPVRSHRFISLGRVPLVVESSSSWPVACVMIPSLPARAGRLYATTQFLSAPSEGSRSPWHPVLWRDPRATAPPAQAINDNP